jgi:hypothetical protein
MGGQPAGGGYPEQDAPVGVKMVVLWVLEVKVEVEVDVEDELVDVAVDAHDSSGENVSFVRPDGRYRVPQFQIESPSRIVVL